MELTSKFIDQIIQKLKKMFQLQCHTKMDSTLNMYPQKTYVREDMNFGLWLEQKMEVYYNMSNLFFQDTPHVVYSILTIISFLIIIKMH